MRGKARRGAGKEAKDGKRDGKERERKSEERFIIPRFTGNQSVFNEQQVRQARTAAGTHLLMRSHVPCDRRQQERGQGV